MTEMLYGISASGIHILWSEVDGFVTWVPELRYQEPVRKPQDQRRGNKEDYIYVHFTFRASKASSWQLALQ